MVISKQAREIIICILIVAAAISFTSFLIYAGKKCHDCLSPEETTRRLNKCKEMKKPAWITRYDRGKWVGEPTNIICSEKNPNEKLSLSHVQTIQK